MMKISRRAALAFVAGGVASTGIAYAAVSSFSDEDLVLVTLEKYLGKLNMRVEHLQQFVVEFLQRKVVPLLRFVIREQFEDLQFT